MKAPKWNQNPPIFCYFCKDPGYWERGCSKFKHFPTSSQFLRMGLQGTTGALWETFLQIGDEFLTVLTDTVATFLMLSPTTVKQPLPQRTKTVQIVEIFNEPQEGLSLNWIGLDLGLDPLRETHLFFLRNSVPVHSDIHSVFETS